MGKINHVEKLTNYKFLNLYNINATNSKGTDISYYVASRAKNCIELKAINMKKELRPDAVAIFSFYGEKFDKVVLVKQYRYAIGDYIYEFPAGLVDDNEDIHTTAIREMKEETGLEFVPYDGGDDERPFFSSVGMTDECCSTVYGYAKGTPSVNNQERSEEIEIVIADEKEVKRILKEENVCMKTAYQLQLLLVIWELNQYGKVEFKGSLKNE